MRKAAIVFAFFALSALAQDLPAGKGRETLKKVCTTCHDLDVTVQMRNTRGGWNDIIKSMKDMGAEASPAEFVEILDYLSLNFGKEAGVGKKGDSAASPSAVEPSKAVVRRSLPWEKSQLKIGEALFRENCAVCHDVSMETSKKLGPNFYHLFQRDKMPRANLKPSRSFIAGKIRVGGGLMPAFNKKLTASEIETLVDYMESK